MSNLVPMGSSAPVRLSPRSQRALGRQIATIQSRTAVDLAVIDAASQRWEGVVQGVTAVTGTAQQSVALVAQAEQSLAQAVPHAAPRLALLGDFHALAMTSIVMDTARALGRLA
jgi:hypothetical protein